ncbi:MAG TPA: winged helix DNA-binding domain-containing protein [Candidatus Acidoferrales bacterium]|nr:winged helix DNA-binding domain-containing protein [Candidatus Acidoferrales bacterium]
MALDIPHTRLENQRLTSSTFAKPEDVVSWFGAIQAQDFAAAKWAIAQRCTNQTDASIEQAFNDGRILRTHVMRPTWHFATPADIRWLLALTAERIHRFNGYYYRQTGLDKTIFQKSNEVIRKALADGQQLTRDELNTKLKDANIPTENLGLSYTIMQAELDGVIISGPRRGKQFTYMLFNERVPKQPEKTRDEALAELTRRYFQSHGPATLQDFVWWSGLTVADAKHGIAMNKKHFIAETLSEKQYWFRDTLHTKIQTHALLLPNYDEYIVGYTNRSMIYDTNHDHKLDARGNALFQHTIVLNGNIIGTWKREIKSKQCIISLNLFEKLTAVQQQAIEQAVNRFGKFLNKPITIQL